MDPNTGRRLTLLLIAAPIVLAAATTFVITHGPRAAFPSGRTAGGASVPHVDAPLAAIPCEELPYKTPEPDEARVDDQTRPYQLRVDTFAFPSLEPVDVDLGRLVVRGAAPGRRVGLGEYVFENVSVGYTTVSLLAPEDPARPRRGPVGGRRERLAERNPVPLARHAMTTCDLVVFEAEDLAWKGVLRGTVEEFATKRPIAGARVGCGMQATLSDDQGRFELPTPLSWGEIEKDTTVTCAGFDPYVLRVPTLPLSWIRDFVERHEAKFWLRTSVVRGAAKPSIPALTR